ncbi:hypothetical protein I0292_21995 [Priestia megaterium]|uniref:Uncharacterized protein n=1 Tax=Priestia megaterium (strain WSH-002) TaxID=1006007 RepID=A0A8D4BRH5_PRIMW|nr:hypothetical protein [Priestia megaterium]AEN90999.1 hypothetical protein BMWSH_4119 [Priestia megaterium WSH-002]UOO40437.1 hypothetical protein I0292_21995 [Priestia megaterium]
MGIIKEEWSEIEAKEGNFFKGVFFGIIISALIWIIVIKILIEAAM